MNNKANWVYDDGVYVEKCENYTAAREIASSISDTSIKDHSIKPGYYTLTVTVGDEKREAVLYNSKKWNREGKEGGGFVQTLASEEVKQMIKGTTQEIECSGGCGNWFEVALDVAIYKCADCTLRDALKTDVAYKELMEKEAMKREDERLGYYSGWRWMKLYVGHDGRVFRSGKECPDEFGTLEPTPTPDYSTDKKKVSNVEDQQKLAILLKESDRLKNSIIRYRNIGNIEMAVKQEKELLGIRNQLKNKL